MLNQHSKKHHHAGTPNVVSDPLVDPGNPSHRYQARSTAHLDRPCSRMVALLTRPTLAALTSNKKCNCNVRLVWNRRATPFKGWGVREATMMVAFGYAGLAQTDGTVVSILLGAV
jgi:hypothetical protein